MQRCGLQAPQHCTQASLQVRRGEKRRWADRAGHGVRLDGETKGVGAMGAVCRTARRLSSLVGGRCCACGREA